MQTSKTSKRLVKAQARVIVTTIPSTKRRAQNSDLGSSRALNVLKRFIKTLLPKIKTWVSETTYDD